jgi:hypothetical protein
MLELARYRNSCSVVNSKPGVRTSTCNIEYISRCMHRAGTVDRRGYGGQQRGSICDARGPCPSIWNRLKPVFRQIRLISFVVLTSCSDAYILNVAIFVLTTTTQPKLLYPLSLRVWGIIAQSLLNKFSAVLFISHILQYHKIEHSHMPRQAPSPG